MKTVFQYLYLITHVSHFLSLLPNLFLILCIPSKRLLARFYNELTINPALSVYHNMADIFRVLCNFFPFLSIRETSFSIGFVKVMYFLVFPPKQVNWFLNSSPNYFMLN